MNAKTNDELFEELVDMEKIELVCRYINLRELLKQAKPWIETYETFDENDEEDRLDFLKQYNELMGEEKIDGR